MPALNLPFAWELLNRSVAVFGFGLASYWTPERRIRLAKIQRLKADREMLLTPLEATQIVCAVTGTAKLGGHMAEVGVYRGASARLIRESDQYRELHLFDTFSGLPDTSAADTYYSPIRYGTFQPGEYACGLESVQTYLSGLHGLHYHAGFFPATGSDVEDLRFSFVHADVDIYESTKSVLEFFYPRMLPGGMILTHDYATSTGARKAFNEFFVDKVDPVLELSGNQAVVTVIGR